MTCSATGTLEKGSIDSPCMQSSGREDLKTGNHLSPRKRIDYLSCAVRESSDSYFHGS